ncbi:MAG: hypothetical protein J7502_19830, partial [Flavisolibacter sp.]|nr:hypothetical protein [Flavisolibacter sp.]
MIPFEFIVPKAATPFLCKSATIPLTQEIRLPYSNCRLQQWTLNGTNYILEQSYENNGSLVTLLTIVVSNFSLIKINCLQSFSSLLYTLKGSCFANLRGYGCLPLFTDNYTLQYVPKGTHKVLFSPGTYHYLYVNPGQQINLLAPHDAGIGKIIALEKDIHEDGKLANRLPIDPTVKGFIDQLLSLKDNTAELPFTVSSIVTSLLFQYYKQLHQPERNDGANFRATLNAYLANHIELPVNEIIKNLKSHFFIEGRPLRMYWKKSSP